MTSSTATSEDDMSDIPEDVMKVAREVAWEIDATDDPRVVEPIARAIHAAVEAERERIAAWHADQAARCLRDQASIQASGGWKDTFLETAAGFHLHSAAAIRTPSVPVEETT